MEPSARYWKVSWRETNASPGFCFLFCFVLSIKKHMSGARFGSTYTKIGTMQRRLAWPLRKDDTQIREVFHIFEHHGQAPASVLRHILINHTKPKKKKKHMSVVHLKTNTG